MKILVKILKYLSIIFIGMALVFTIGGLIIKNKGQSEIDLANLRKDKAKLVTDKNGRRIEYFLYGSDDPNAPVAINIHGSGLEGSFERSIYETTCEQLGIKGIAISLPGCGNTDMKVGRSVIDWAAEDLQAVLEKEKVSDFFITGHSQGTPHAMAAAYHFGERCIGLGLNAPLLPSDVTTEAEVPGAMGIENLPTTEQLKRPLYGWWFCSFYLATDLFSPFIPLTSVLNAAPNMEEDTELIQNLKRAMKRAMVRGTAANAWESSQDVCYDWGFDPRKITVKNICIWHPSDDSFCPPEIGAWLAAYYKGKGFNVNFKNENIGYNHFTYCNSHYRKPENNMITILMERQLPKPALPYEAIADR